MIIISTHTSINLNKKENFGPFHNFERFLVENKVKYVSQKEVISLNPIKILIKLYKNLRIIYKNKKFKIYIGFDPINALSGIIGKIIFNKNLKVIFYSIDYSKSRTGNILLDFLYIWLDKFVSINSDETWNCSYRVYKLRKSYKIKNNYFIPNIPVIDKPSTNKFPKFTAVFTGYLNHVYRLDLLLEIIKKVEELDINLYIIGDGPQKTTIKEQIQNLVLYNRVFLTGYMDHKEVIEILSKSHLGLALYSGSESYDEYRDSMKVREFTYLEIPTLTTNKIPNAEEITKYNLGKVISNIEEISGAIKFYKVKKNFDEVKKNCLEYNKSIDIKTLFKSRIF